MTDAHTIDRHKIIDGRAQGRAILDGLKPRVEALQAAGWPPRLVSITVGVVDEVALYVRNQKRQAERAGIQFDERNFDADITQEELCAAIAAMNVDPRVSGIIVQRPMPAHLPVRAVQETIHPMKDVEGMHPFSIGKIVYRQPEMGPCTAMAAVHLLKSTGMNLEGQEICVVGHSAIVGKPIAFLVMAEGATVTVCHHMTRNLAVHSRQADAVFVAVGKPGLITGAMIKPGAAVIDIGINQVDLPDGSSKVVGDADFDSCAEVAGWITPVPGGVGPVTVAILMRNAVIATERQKTHYEQLLGQSAATPPLKPAQVATG
jgi:methylenetetrahydrofolate dehydrogenase (NADP+)/methenyltetrahydrofolate cyclohydrolase